MWLPFDPLGVRRFVNAKRLVRAIVSREMELHHLSLDPQNPRDYIDAFLLEAEAAPATSNHSNASCTSSMSLHSTFSSACLLWQQREIIWFKYIVSVYLSLNELRYYIWLLYSLYCPWMNFDTTNLYNYTSTVNCE